MPVALASSTIVDREETPPSRTAFLEFPMNLGSWHGTSLALEKPYIEALRLDDYALADYYTQGGDRVNFYSAYYRSQKKGRSVHSPQSCLPGGGWTISSLTRVPLPSFPSSMVPLHANRAVIQKDDQRQVVLYWFKQRERILADEYLVKLYLLWDAFSRERTDGALIRLASLVGDGETEEAVDRRLFEFAKLVGPELSRFVPD
jgi:EpsI family protein